MLFLETKSLNHPVDGDARTRLLQELEERGLSPLIRSARLRFFEDVLLGADRIAELETALTSYTHTTIDEPFVRGDVFCFDDYVLFLLFEDDDTLRAGIVYEPRTPEPFRKLDSSARTFAICCLPTRTATTCRSGSRASPQCRKAFARLSKGRTPIRFTPVCVRRR
jgi:hypothetical protein